MNIYQENILDHYKNSPYRGALPDATATVEQSNPLCGDVLTIYVRLEDENLHYAFEGEGCAISQAAASILGGMINAQPKEKAMTLSDKTMLDELGIPLSPSRTKCGLLALSGLRQALIKGA